MPEKPRDPTPQEMENEENLRRFESDIDALQRNTLPLDAERTDAQVRLFTRLLRGPLGPRARFVLLLVGTVLAASGLLDIYSLSVFVRFVVGRGQSSVGVGADFSTLTYFVIFAILSVIGVRLIFIALRRERRHSP